MARAFVNTQTFFSWIDLRRPTVSSFMWNLVCDRAWIPPATASIQIGAQLLGNFFSGHIADTLGRKRPLFFSLAMLIVFNLLAFFSVSWVMYTITRALIGAALGLYLTIRYNFMSEFSLSRWRPWIVGFPSWSVEACLLALVLWLVKDWRKAHLAPALIGVPFIATWWFIPESFRWYYAHDRIEDAERVITTMSKVNQRPVPDMTYMKQLAMWNLVCDRAWIPPATASIQIGAQLLGNFFSGHIADTLGRKRPLFFSLAMLIVFNLLAFFSVSWVMYTITRALIGAALGLYLTIRYNFMSEFSLSRWRPWIVGFPSWSVEACLLALVLWLVKDWRKAHLAPALIGVPFIATWWFIPESFRWYYAHDRIEDAERVITTMSKVNQRPVPDMTYMKQLAMASLEENKSGKKYTALNLFKSRFLTKCTIILSLNWFALGLISYGIFFGIQNLSGSIYLNLFLFPLVEIPPRFIEPFLLNRFGRRLTTMVLFAFTGTALFIVAVVQYIDTEHKDDLTKYFALAANFGIATTWPAVQTMTVEIYPTLVRNIGFGFCSVFGRVAATLGPQLAFLEASIPGVLYFSCGGVAALCIFGLFFLPETKDSNLSDKLHETISPERAHDQTSDRVGMARLD